MGKHQENNKQNFKKKHQVLLFHEYFPANTVEFLRIINNNHLEFRCFQAKRFKSGVKRCGLHHGTYLNLKKNHFFSLFFILLMFSSSFLVQSFPEDFYVLFIYNKHQRYSLCCYSGAVATCRQQFKFSILFFDSGKVCK